MAKVESKTVTVETFDITGLTNDEYYAIRNALWYVHRPDNFERARREGGDMFLSLVDTASNLHENVVVSIYALE